MRLPLALTDRSPDVEYLQMHNTVESALKHSMTDALNLYYDIKQMEEIEQLEMTLPEEYLSKEGRFALKRDPAQNHSTKFIQRVIEKKQKYDLLIKNTDYPAMIMAAYPEAKLLAKSQFWDNADDCLQHPLLLRGISSGKIANYARERGQDYYFIETGYLGNYRSENNETGRKIYHRIVKNEMQHSKIMDVPDDRWQELVKFNPDFAYKGWKRTGSKILLVLPSTKPFQYYGADRDAWIKKVLKALAKHTDRPVVIREKERRGNRTESNTIYDAMNDDVYALVTYNSIAAVEAVAHGIPAFALAPTAAAPVCSASLSKIEDPFMPDEDFVQKWLHSIAYGQWTLEEMLTGQAWKMVLENEQRATISY